MRGPGPARWEYPGLWGSCHWGSQRRRGIGDEAGTGVRLELPGLAGQGKRFGVITRPVHQKGVLGKEGAWLGGKKQGVPGRWVGREAVV